MDFLDESSPCHALKATEHSVYMSHWSTWLEGASSVLDVGCGIGRFTLPLLDQGVTVYGVDADHESLLRCAWRAAGKAGSLALSWSSVHALPDVQVDVAIASEVLCYVPETRTALRALADRVRPGGVLLLSVEARWGWAASPDAPEGALEAALSGDGVVDREQAWVRTMTEADVRGWIAEAELELVEVVASHYVLDGPLEQVAGEAPSLADVLTWEARCRAHPVWSPLNRLWLVVARKPLA
jgi:2-polyprenyl-3-methyl-5-hydroxy-6-metoxy-1,4-benzoquinol methylase